MKLMLIEKAKYLAFHGEKAGTASGFREWVKEAAATDPRLFPVDALRDEAATKAWQTKPATTGGNLFSVAGINVPQFLTRHRKGFVESDVVDDPEELFEKIDSRFATVDDYSEDVMIKLRNAARASAAAEKEAQHVDECLRLARFNRAARLRDLADKK